MPEPTVLTVPEVAGEIYVELGGARFLSREPTKSLTIEAERPILDMLGAETNEELIDAIGSYFDVKLKPTEGRRKKASAVIRELWDRDEITIPRLQALAENLREAERPI